MMNATLNNGRSFNKIFIQCLFLVFQAIRKSKIYVKFELILYQNLFYARSSIKNGKSGVCLINWRNRCKRFTKFDSGTSLKQIFIW